MTTLYYSIRYREELEYLDATLNMELEKTNVARDITTYADHVQRMSFEENPAIMEGLLEEIENGQFLGIPQPYLHAQVMDPNNNLLILFTLNEEDEIQIEGLITYHQITKRGKESIAIPTVAIIDLPKKNLHISGTNLMEWFYRKMKEVGGYSIEIDAIGTSMKFWREKMKFSWKRLNPRGKRAEIIRAIIEKEETRKLHRSKKVRDQTDEEISGLYGMIPSARMRRTRSDRSIASEGSSEEISPDMLSLQEMNELFYTAPKPKTIRRASSYSKPRRRTSRKMGMKANSI